MVLTKEEYEKLGLFEESVQEYKSDNGQLVLVKERKTLQKYSIDIADFIRKETAKEIVEKVKKQSETFLSGLGNGTYVEKDYVSVEYIEELAKKYGVEVEE